MLRLVPTDGSNLLLHLPNKGSLLIITISLNLTLSVLKTVIQSARALIKLVGGIKLSQLEVSIYLRQLALHGAGVFNPLHKYRYGHGIDLAGLDVHDINKLGP